MHEHIGIDGCKAGWIWVKLDKEGNWDLGVVGSISELFSQRERYRLVLVDIPIGLPFSSRRECDRIARKYLTRQRSSSVFPVPSRAALYATDYQTACEINQELMGVKLSKQTWNIRDKIIEVDRQLNELPELRQTVRECHPEVAFWSLAGKRPMTHVKRSTAGIVERLATLKNHFNPSDEIYREALIRFSRKEVAHDDVIDAIALAVTATFAERIVSIPPIPESDETSLPMEIVFGEFE